MVKLYWGCIRTDLGRHVGGRLLHLPHWPGQRHPDGGDVLNHFKDDLIRSSATYNVGALMARTGIAAGARERASLCPSVHASSLGPR